MENTENGKMKAIVYNNYGSPDVLELKEVKSPLPQDDEVQVNSLLLH